MTHIKFTTKRGEDVDFVTPLTNEQAIKILENETSEFAKSLVFQHTNSKRPLSQNQWNWVHKIVHDRATPKSKAKPLDVPRIMGLLTTASQHMNFPKIRFDEMQLSYAKKSGKAWLKSDGVLVGMVEPGETIIKPIRGGFSVEEAKLIRLFNADPIKFAMHKGRLLGNCIFCYRALSDNRSTAVGYGKTCARHYSLPWTPEEVEAHLTNPAYQNRVEEETELNSFAETYYA